jgi:cellulose synthase/poly-beta-1,6-N-acetylglucosamine synthase-like glycosyltransferase
VDLQALLDLAYLSTLGLLAVFGLHRLANLARWRRVSWERTEDRREMSPAADAPIVTVQLPLYNERTVAVRLMRAVAALDWPKQRLELQVLDDSTDETGALIDGEAERLQAQGFDVKVLRREGRAGFKAGALQRGLAEARGDLLAVFDGDFQPRPDFLRRLVGLFEDPRVGMVQARWGHSNRDENLLTRAEATLLDGHFVIEHQARFAAGLFFNFNGTAGIWRRAAIVDAGGWQHDTLTEDLDLSYRAQLAGWRFIYARDVVAPAEVPVDLAAFRSQQQRWARGSVQVLRKLGWRIGRAPIPRRVKLEALLHLASNAGYPLVLLLALLLPLVAIMGHGEFGWLLMASFLSCSVVVLAFYETSQRALGAPLGRRLQDSLAAVALGIGMSPSLSRAVLAGLGRDTGTFVRTPKRGDGTQPGYSLRAGGLPGIELALALWFAIGLVAAALGGSWISLPFLGLFLWGFTWVGLRSLNEQRNSVGQTG